MSPKNPDSVNKTERATDPYATVAVFASAGSGKTYLLVHRILKLLLNGAAPAHILAITFTRKAAAEMQERLMKILSEWATASDSQLKNTLKNLSHPCDDTSITKARKLYEVLLFAEQEIRITTFHAFCQDMLKRFAIHAGVPAGFQVVESNFDLKKEARKQLAECAQSQGDGKLRQALFTLLRHCNSVNNVDHVLDAFIDSRCDWWSFTKQHDDPVTYASQHLRKRLLLDEFDAVACIEELSSMIREYLTLLARYPTKTNHSHCEKLSAYLTSPTANSSNLENLKSVFFTNEMKKRVLKPSNVLEKKLGPQKVQRFLLLNERICERLERYMDFQKKQALFEFNQAWFYAGHRLAECYQTLKFKQNCLDFDDLEWYSCLLLNQYENASWIQYKLDQHIQHILIDEFQDTNPMQWKLISPLLNELAIDAHENHRSVFFVGDIKQSIYGFRGANPELLLTAAEWTKQHLDADILQTHDSYRSSPAIINFVNQVFSQDKIKPKDFHQHYAAQSRLWGKVEVMPLISSDHLDREDAKTCYFRDPMRHASPDIEHDCHYLESVEIAGKISSLINNSTVVADASGNRFMQYRDIMILARSRTHLRQLETALQEQAIPYNSIYDRDFLASLEVQDILALLTYLIQRHNDLALAQVLRSPLYGMSDEDFMQIAIQPRNSWHEKLECYAQSPNASVAKQAFEQLQQWRDLANTQPVHDLLDQIFFQTNIFERYQKSIADEPAADSEYAPEFKENLISLLALSLDIDAGRYSSIETFLQTLQKPNAMHSLASSLRKRDQNAVQVMTIHSAKGLESPVVFLIDSGPQKTRPRAYQTLIDWPSTSDRPEQFFILGRKSNVDSHTQTLIEKQQRKEKREALNLLYVALTRAKQYLFISACAPGADDPLSWYSMITSSLSETPKHEPWSHCFGKQPKIDAPAQEPHHQHILVHAKLGKPFDPDDKTSTKTQEPAREQTLADYGTLVHKIFELIKPGQSQDQQALKAAVEFALGNNLDAHEFQTAFEEVQTCLQAPGLEPIFRQTHGKKILKEVPISYIQNDKICNCILDHLLIDETSAWIIDYKTTRGVTSDTMQEHANEYLAQTARYHHAVRKLYPQKSIRSAILFTSIPALFELNF